MSRLEPGHPYRHLLSPGRIGPLELRNRILMCPMGDNLARENGEPSPLSMDYFEARARGGVGLILVGSVAVSWPEGSYNPNQSSLSDDRYIPAFSQLASRVHAHGARIAAQLSHGGITAVNDIRDGRPMWVPSMPEPSAPDPLMEMVTPEERALQSRPMRTPTSKASLHVMTKADIRWLIEQFADAADRAQRAGLDGVEIHAGHGYVLSAFLSPAKNKRTDKYGSTGENRTRLLGEVVAAVRGRVGPDFAVWCRLDSVEFWEEKGITPELACEAARVIEGAGGDAIHASANGVSGNALTYTEGHTTHEPAGLLSFAETIRASVDIPVIAVGRIEPEVAESAIAEGKVDFVAMGRKLLADPDLPGKLADARPEDVRPCMYHYNCIGQIFLREPVRCWANPATGRESEFDHVPTSEPRRILVVGGGPAGLEAARVSASRGHDVTLCEASDRLGGRFALAAKTYEPNARMLAWLAGQARKAGVEIRLETTADERLVDDFSPDALLLATGAEWPVPPIPGLADDPRVHTVDRLRPFLDEQDDWGERIVILGGGRAGAGLADFCVRRGQLVTVLEETSCLVTQMGLPGRWRIVHELRELGVQLMTDAHVQGLEASALVWTDAAGTSHRTAADTILVASGARPDSSIAGSLGGSLETLSIETHRIGDCAEVGFVRGALESATRVAMRL